MMTSVLPSDSVMEISKGSAHSEGNSGNKDIPHPPVQEYEDLFETVQSQLKQCQDEQNTLRSKLESLVQENESLAGQLQDEIRKNSSIETYVKSQSSNMKQQLEASIQERDSAIDMWQTALQLVSALENELKDYRDNSHLTSAVEKIHEVRAEYSRAISLLEEKLASASARLAKETKSRETAEEKLKQVENDHKLLAERYEKRCSDVDEALVAKEITLKKLEELEKRHSETVADSKEAKLSCSELEAALERSLARLEEVLNRETEAREKVDEALQIVDAALIERDNALKNASQKSEEVEQLRAALNEVISEAATEVQAEAEKIKGQYNTKIKTVLLDMRRLQVENKNRNAQIQKLKSDLNAMESELQRSKRELDVALRDRPSLSALDRKLEGLFRTQELAGGDSIRADLELECLRAEIIKLTQSYEMEQHQNVLERHVLEEQIALLQTEAENYTRIIADYAEKNNALNITIEQKDQELTVLKSAFSSSNNLRCQSCLGETGTKLGNQYQSLMDGQRVYHELQGQLESQRELTNKWKSEVKLITARFQSRLRELHSESSALRKENRDLKNKIKAGSYESDRIMNDKGNPDSFLR